MIRNILLVILSSFLFVACKKVENVPFVCPYKDSIVVAPVDEIAAVQSYADASGISGVMDPSGVFYKIEDPGKEISPSICSKISIIYRGRLTNGHEFDFNTSGITFLLGSLILGWQKGLPHIQKGGSIKLIVPPSLGYGNAATRDIPANSILVFDIQLLNVQ